MLIYIPQTARFLYRELQRSKWLEPPEDEFGVVDSSAKKNLGVLIKRSNNSYSTEPTSLNPDIVNAVQRLGVSAAFTMSSEIVSTLLIQLTPLQTELSMNRGGFVLPIVKSVNEIGTARSPVQKENWLCLCKEEKFTLIWSDSVNSLLVHGSDIESKFIGLVSTQYVRMRMRETDTSEALGFSNTYA
jgi:hypothetical protein